MVSRTFLSIQAVFNNVVVWMVFTRTPTSKFSWPINNPLVSVPKAPVTIGIIVTFMFCIFFQFSCKVEVLISLFTFFQFYSVVIIIIIIIQFSVLFSVSDNTSTGLYPRLREKHCDYIHSMKLYFCWFSGVIFFSHTDRWAVLQTAHFVFHIR